MKVEENLKLLFNRIHAYTLLRIYAFKMKSDFLKNRFIKLIPSTFPLPPSAFILLFVSVILISNCFSANFPSDINLILKRGKIVVAVYHKDIFPFFFHDKKGNFVGYDIDLAKNISKALGVNLKFNREAKSFNQIIDLVSTGKADIGISLISITLNRAKKVLFSKPYIVLHPVLVLNRVKASNYKFKYNSILPGKIAVKKGTSYVDFAKEIFVNPETILVDSWDNAIKNVYAGKFFCFLRDEVGVNNMIDKNPSLSIRLKTITLKKFNDNIAIAVNPAFTHLHYWINLFLKTHPLEKDVFKIIKEYRWKVEGGRRKGEGRRR